MGTEPESAPSSFQTGIPSALPRMSQSATSIAEMARVTSPAGEPPPALRARLRPIASTAWGSAPTVSAASASTVSFSAFVTSVDAKPAYAMPSMPSSVRRRSVT